MNRSTTTLLLTLIVLGISLATVADLRACDARARGIYRARPSYFQPRLYTPPRRIVRSRPQPIVQPQAQFRPVQPRFVAQQPVPRRTQAVQPAKLQVAPGQQPATTNTPPASSAQMTALQALAGLAANPAQSQVPATASQSRPRTQSQPTSPPQVSGHVGSWTASLGNGARVQLVLQADGSFSWTATNQSGATSTFQGNYTAGNGSLTLIRSKDNQKLAGTMTSTGTNAFNFQLTGAKDSGLDFVRG